MLPGWQGRTVGNSFIFGPTGMVAIHQKMNNKEEHIFYAHSDHLGSVMGFTDDSGAIVQGSVASFDAWGNRRDPETWQPYTSTPPALLFDRGYTGHEHIEQAGLINMNGRVYDPLVARFLSPDPFIQAPDYSQSFNRYSYVMNDPINLVDRSGYYWEGYDEDYDDYYLDGDYPNVNPPRDDKRWFERLFSELSDAWNEIESIWNDRNDFDESTDFLYTEMVDNNGYYFLDDQFEYYDDYNSNDYDAAGGGGGLHLNSTASYIYDGQFKTAPLIHSMQAGQHVRVEVKNMNILGVQLDLQDKSRYTYERNWLGIERKVYTGDSHPMVLLPGQTRSFDFYMFTYVPMYWQFEISTRVSGAANVQIRFYSDWIPGMPYDPNHLNR